MVYFGPRYPQAGLPLNTVAAGCRAFAGAPGELGEIRRGAGPGGRVPSVLHGPPESPILCSQAQRSSQCSVLFFCWVRLHLVRIFLTEPGPGDVTRQYIYGPRFFNIATVTPTANIPPKLLVILRQEPTTRNSLARSDYIYQSTWTPKICKIPAFWAFYIGLGPLF